MKFPRNARIFRGQLDAAPLALVFFLLVIFLMLGSLVYTPGVRLRLPVTEGLPGLDRPSVSVAIDASGRLYYQNQVVERDSLLQRLKEAAAKSSEPLTLVIQADKDVTYEMLVNLAVLARDAGLVDSWTATLPRAVAAPGQRLQP
jgi:biopolymer transport protein ExbD